MTNKIANILKADVEAIFKNEYDNIKAIKKHVETIIATKQAREIVSLFDFDASVPTSQKTITNIEKKMNTVR